MSQPSQLVPASWEMVLALSFRCSGQGDDRHTSFQYCQQLPGNVTHCLMCLMIMCTSVCVCVCEPIIRSIARPAK